MPDSSERKILRVGEWVLLRGLHKTTLRGDPPEPEPARVSEIRLVEEEGGAYVSVPAVPWIAVLVMDPCVTILGVTILGEDGFPLPRDRIRHFPFND